MSTPSKGVIFSHFLMMVQEAVWLVLEFGAFLGLTEVRRNCGINLLTRNTYLSKLTFQRQLMRFNAHISEERFRPSDVEMSRRAPKQDCRKVLIR